MEYEAVIFDLFGTLVKGAWEGMYQRSFEEMAGCVGADGAALRRAWSAPDVLHRRATGALATPQACVRCVCDRLHLATA